MIEAEGDLWDFHAIGAWVAITTNGFVKKNGEAVMGRGVAKEAAQRFPWLPAQLGERTLSAGNHVQIFSHIRLFTFPVKHHWHEPADPDLIVQSARELRGFLDDPGVLRLPKRVYLVRPGCGNGQLRWEDVRPLIAPILDDRFIVVERP
jgi:hypothetical protein